DSCFVRDTYTLNDPADASLNEIAHLRLQRAHRPGDLGGLGDDVVGVAGVELRHRYNRRFDRVDGAGNDGLQRLDDRGTHDQRIDRAVRLGGVAAASGDVDGELIGCGHQRAGADGEGAGGDAGHVVHAEHLLDAPALHQAVLDHRLAAGAAFFRRLENDDGGAVEVAALGEVARGAEEHR